MIKKRIGAITLSWMLVISMLIPATETVFAAQLPSDEAEIAEDNETEAGPGTDLVSGYDLKDDEASDIPDLEDLDEDDMPYLSGDVNGTISDDELTVEGDGSVGQMLADKIGDQLAAREQNNGCFIRSLSVSGRDADVSFETVQNATVVVGIYTEDGSKLLQYGSKDVTRGDTKVEITLSASVPEYFYAKAYLVTVTDQRPLCNVFCSPEYTKDMTQLRNSTIYNYDSSRVLNLDASTSNNFLVYDAGVKQIVEETGKNTFSKTGNNRYRITNADSTATGLASGNIAAIRRINGEIVITKVKTVSVSGNVVNITGEAVKMEQAFDYVKIDSTGGMDDTTVDNSKCSPGVKVIKNGAGGETSYAAKDEEQTASGETDEAEQELTVSGEENVPEDPETLPLIDADEEIPNIDEVTENTEGGVSVSEVSEDGEASADLDTEIEINVSKSVSYAIDKKFGSDANNVTLSGVVDFASGVKAKVEVTPQNQYLELNVEYTAGIRLKATGHCQATLQLGKFMVMPVPGVFIEFTPSLIAELSGAIELNGTLTGGSGIKVDGKSGISNTSKTPQFNAEIKGEVTVFVGFSMEPEVAVLCDQFANAGITAKAGVEANGTINASTENGYGDKHLCGNKCIKGELYGRLSISASASFLNNENLTYEYTMVDAKIKINDYYYSIKYKDFGWGECPHFKDPFQNVKPAAQTDFLFDTHRINGPNGEYRYVADVAFYTGNSAVVSVPATYTKDELENGEYVKRTYEVTDILGLGAGENQNKITAVKLPNSIEGINTDVFLNFPKLKRIYIPKGLQWMGGGVFAECKSLEEIELPDCVTSLSMGAVRKGFFQDCTSLKRVKLGSNVKYIGDGAFMNCKSLTDIDLPASVKLIGYSAFMDCKSLKSIRIPNATYAIAMNAFENCTKLEEVTMGSGLDEIAQNAFSDCTSLKKIKWSPGLRVIGKDAFYNCRSLKELRLPDGLQEIGYCAFSGCSSVKKLYIPASVRSVNSSFDYQSLTDIYYGGSKSQLKKLLGDWVANSKKIKIHYNSSMKSGDGEEDTPEDPCVDIAGKTKEFKGLDRNMVYNVSCVKTSKIYDIFSEDNLLFMDQVRSDGNGRIKISFVPRTSSDHSEYILRAFKSLKAVPAKQVKKIELNKSKKTVKAGKTFQLKATLTPKDATDKTVIWSSDNETVATVSNKGKVKAKSAGTAVITARTTNGKKASCKITVSGIKLNDSVLYIQKGKTSTAIKVTGVKDSVKSVKSNNKKIAGASLSGKKIKVKGLKPGKATITVKSQKGVTKKLKVIVQKDKVKTKKLTVSSTKATLAGKGKKAKVSVTATPNALSTGEKIKVSSSNKKIATASFNKKTGKLVITAVKKGKCKVTVKAGKKKKRINVTVTK